MEAGSGEIDFADEFVDFVAAEGGFDDLGFGVPEGAGPDEEFGADIDNVA